MLGKLLRSLFMGSRTIKSTPASRAETLYKFRQGLVGSIRAPAGQDGETQALLARRDAAWPGSTGQATAARPPGASSPENPASPSAENPRRTKRDRRSTQRRRTG